MEIEMKPQPQAMTEAITSIRGILVLLETAPEEIEFVAFQCSVLDGRRIGGAEEEQVYSQIVGPVDIVREVFFESLALFEYGTQEF